MKTPETPSQYIASQSGVKTRQTQFKYAAGCFTRVQGKNVITHRGRLATNLKDAKTEARILNSDDRCVIRLSDDAIVWAPNK